ncbi:hypothetical protein ACT17_06260 [Mycolicibacterium conceptionense]|uniref:DNA ligase (ATP) n=2 Tax=Mycolicibacterium conceptionense TaxID=451644 RepID=A0A0J8UDN2_9MYCO|nr:hypothetical protein ACT17_06260 [Mycolicibacterium conceptionense]
MLVTLGKPPSGPGWATEYKWDGFRSISRVTGSGVDVFTRNGAHASSTFPELAGLQDVLDGREAVLDGEIVALDRAGRPSFSRLQRRWPMRRRPATALLRDVPVRLFAFDLIGLDGRDLTGLPYARRRAALDEIGRAAEPGVLVVPPAWEDADSHDMLAAAREHAVEGIVCKRVDSLYVPGRSKAWIKCPVRQTVELVIVAWSPRRGPGAAEQIGTLLMAGRQADGELVIVGEVGTGFSAVERRRLFQLLSVIARRTPALAAEPGGSGWNWVETAYVGEIAYREYQTGRGLRHASWKGLRTREAGEVGMPEIVE